MNQFLILRLRFLLWQKRKYSNERMKLLGSINNIMNRINECFEKNIINQYYFNTYLSTLEEIHERYKQICKVTIYNLSHNRILINKIRDRLVELSKKTGMMNISSITSLNFCLDVKDLEIDDKNIVEFVDLVFNPFSYSIYDINQNDNDKSNNKLSLFNQNKNNNQTHSQNDKAKLHTHDWNNIIKLKNIMFTKLSKKNSLVESINGTRIYISIKINAKKYALVIDGYFKNDSLNISRYNGFIFDKQQTLINKIVPLDINDKFKIGYIEQISIRDMLMYDVNDLMINMKTAYETICEFKKKTISQTVKEFLNKSLEEQRDLITYFLLCDEDSEFQYFSFLLYDLINNESYLLKAQPLADQIFNSLHWSIQKHFKNTVEQVEEYTKKLMNMGDDTFSYEKRVCLMRTSDAVKSKAMEKLKEINNKNSENCSKAQQYLDSLLKIPFGINRSEDALNALDQFKCTLENFIITGINLINDSLINKKGMDFDKSVKLKDVLAFLEAYRNHNWKYDTIHEFIESLRNKYQKINNTEVNIETDDKEENNKLITLVEIKLNKLVKKELVNLIGLINETITNSISANNLSIKKIGNKSVLISRIVTYLKKINVEHEEHKSIWEFLNLDINFLDKNLAENEDTNFNISMKIQDNLNKPSNNSLFKEDEKLRDIIEKTYDSWNSLRKLSAKYMTKIDDTLDASIYGQNDAKQEIKRIIAQWINGESSGYCLGFEGPPGTGKTSLAKYGIANCLKDSDGSPRPFSFIALGGSSNGSTLEGHNYTYVGSTYGKIVDILIESQCMNPIIYIDELDKISNTDNGRELIGILTHLTDSTQNDQFMDKYFAGIPLDLSKVLFIFSYNDYYLLDSILADRIHRVKFDYLKITEKTHILSHYLIPNMLTTIGFNKKSINISTEAILFIIKNYTYEAGVRKLKERVLEIIRQINLELIQDADNKFIKNKVIDIKYVSDFFKDKPKIHVKKIGPYPQVGLVNGLFATAAGMGGITIIEAFKTPNDTKLALTITGQQGDVMKESITCAKTIAWNIIPCDIKRKIIKDIKDEIIQPFGVHIHCPEAATPKDGPSAGAAITLAMVSLLTNTKVNNEVAMTGEIDLNGQVHTIGGLDLKIDGGKWAGVKKILVPDGNRQDLDIIKLKNPTILENIEIVVVTNIWEVLEHALVYADKQEPITFNDFTELC
jgi:endopeptidase La